MPATKTAKHSPAQRATTAPAAVHFPAIRAAILRMENSCYGGDPTGTRTDCCAACYRPAAGCPRDTAQIELGAASELVAVLTDILDGYWEHVEAAVRDDNQDDDKQPECKRLADAMLARARATLAKVGA